MDGPLWVHQDLAALARRRSAIFRGFDIDCRSRGGTVVEQGGGLVI